MAKRKRKPQETFDKEIYSPNIWNAGKKVPRNFDKLVIPKIEKLTKRVPGEIIKNSIYNAIIRHYDKGIKEGILESIAILREEGVYVVAFKITSTSIQLKLIFEEDLLRG